MEPCWITYGLDSLGLKECSPWQDPELTLWHIPSPLHHHQIIQVVTSVYSSI